MDENDSNIGDWLTNLRKKEAEQSAQASAIIEKHLAEAGLPFKKWGEPNSWFGVGWELYLNVDGLLKAEEHSAMLRALLAELVDFCEVSTSESFVYKLKILFEKFIDSDPPRGLFMRLLPAKALAEFDEIDRMLDDDHERYMEMLNQQGY